jgi:chromosomal replication initiation ATPase DnaA
VSVDQLTFDLPHRAAHGAEDFLLSACNLAAVRLIDAWPDWRDPVQLLIGPAASGKTHLARVWQARSGARTLTDTSLYLTAIDGAGEGTALVVEDIDRAGYEEKALFHLMNLARERGFSVLLTSRELPARIGCALPDLLSRLNGLPVVQIGVPDEALLKSVMLKHFADRQLNIDPKVLDYLALRVDRSLAAAALAVAAVDRAALASGRKISRQLVADALAATALAEEGPGG